MIRPAVILAGLLLSLATSSSAQLPTVHSGGTDARVQFADGLDGEIFARRVGQITDMALAENGSLYLTDRSGGRIIRVIDRDKDGQAELTQALPHRFDGPGGLVLIGELLFVTDRGGVWRIDQTGGTPILIAPFARMEVADRAVPITVSPRGQLRIGLNLTNGETRMIDVDPVTGRADVVEGADGQLVSFARDDMSPQNGNYSPWLVLRKGDETRIGASLGQANFFDGQASHVWLDKSKGRAFIASEGTVEEARATFGNLTMTRRTILSGLTGTAGPLHADERGLFVAEPQRGQVWRIYAATVQDGPEEPQAEADDAEPADQDTITDKPPESPALLRGSGIDRASQMGPASTMDPASTLPSADPPQSASESSDGT